ncbi:efflux transporter outer membrane subunit [Burkholderiaceae bacterium DAT-1]|nr:efflux transporter outer membrane subunit [Burkholderiaceae bacterium DAT-1]
MKQYIRGALAIAVSGVLLAGCAAIPPDHGHAAMRAAQSETVPPSTLPQGDWPAADWWKLLGDDQLNALIQQALAHAPQLDVAAARVKQAQLVVDQARADSGPMLSANASLSREYESENYIFPPPLAGSWLTMGRAALDFSYDFDWWGRHRAGVSAALGQTQAARAERAAVENVMTVAVAQSYMAWQVEAARQEMFAQQLKIRDQIRVINQKRLARGLDPVTVQRQTEFEIAAIQQMQAVSEASMRVAEVQLRALTGDTRSPALSPRSLPRMQASVPASLDLVANRADVQASKLRVESLGYRVDAAKAAFYPDFSLTAFAGFTSVELDTLLRSSSRTAGIAPALHLPIFESGRLKANLASEQAGVDLAIAQYNQTIVDAVKEIGEQVALVQGYGKQEQTLRASLDAAAAIEKAVQARADRGLTDQVSVLQSRLPILIQQEQMIQLKGRTLSAQLQLTRALGGGYRAPLAK